MVDQRFYSRKGPMTLEDLARIGECELVRGDPQESIIDVSPLDRASSGEIGVFNNKKYLDSFRETRASACVLSETHQDKAPDGIALLTSPLPDRSYALISAAFYPSCKKEGFIHPTAVVDSSASLGEGCVVGAHAVIGKNVELGDHVEIAPHAVIDDNCILGEGTRVGTHASIEFSIVGKNVHIKPGARLGQSGFGFHMDEKGLVVMPQLGRLIVHDNVEIGANTTVDRGSGGDTVVGDSTRIDNLVQVGHNVEFGKGCIMVAQSGVSGSTKFGDFVAAGGQVGITGHLKIGTGAQLASQSGIMSDVEPGAVLCGAPAMPIKTFYRQVAVLKRLTNDYSKLKKQG